MLAGHISTGHPVDVATGTVYGTYEDVSIPGKIRLKWTRHYSTSNFNATSMGTGWTIQYFANLSYDDDKKEFHFHTPEGDQEIFSDPKNLVNKGETIRNLCTFQELCKRDNQYVVTRWDPKTGDIERYIFNINDDKTWRLGGIEEVTGHSLDMLYNNKGQLTGVQQRLERRTLSIDYDSDSQITSVSILLPDNQRQTLVRYEYDRKHRLTAAYDALGYADRYEYDKDNRMTREILKDGGDFYFLYDEVGRCIKTSGLDRFDEKSMKYYDYAGLTEVTNSLGSITRYQWLPSGQVICEIDPLGGMKRTEYDDCGRIIARIAPDGARTEYEYDANGNLSKTIEPIGKTSQVVFDDRHQPFMMTDPGGGVWKREYDGQSRWVSSEDPLGNKWIFDYDDHGNLIQVNDPKGNQRKLVYSENGILIETSDWSGNMTRFDVNSLGRVISRTDCLNNVTHFHYDAVGNVIGIDYPDGSRIICQYDAGRNIISVNDRNGYTTNFRFGTCERLLERKNPLGNVVVYVWGSEPRYLLGIVNEKGELHKFDYDACGRVIQETCFDKRELRYEYDLSGNCITFINGMGEMISYEYDNLGYMVKKLLPDGSDVSVAYDMHGNVISASNKHIQVELERDPIGRVIRETQGNYIVENEFDAVGDLTTTRTSLGYEVHYQYDARGFLTSLETERGYRMDFTVNEFGKNIKRDLPGGIELLQRYDIMGQLIDQQVENRDNNLIIHRSYRYDKKGNITSINDEKWGEIRYEYDPTDRLIQALSENLSEKFAYDDTGNITSIIRSNSKNSESKILSYGSGNRLTQHDNTQFFYDGNGRLIKKIEETEAGTDEWHYEWDGDDQLISIRRPDGAVWKYAYDPFGRRISKEGPDKSFYFVWNRYDIVHQLENSKLESTWVYNPDSFVPLAKQDDNFYSVITDHLGTPKELIDKQGKVAWSANLMAWGEVNEININDTDCPFRFMGQWFDEESGLHYNYYRYYDPKNGRFLCADPIGLKGGINEFLYANNPVNWIDPLGLSGCDDDEEETPVRIVIDADRYPEAAQHISDNGPVTGRIDRPGAASRRRASLRGQPTASGRDRDEVPPAVLDTGGAGASVRLIDSSDNRGAGSTMGHQMRDLPDGTLVEIVSSRDV